ncbi:MAG: hypothetical protein IPH18_10940 [Chitinophagaceae bacterium]|nr:hypothetical protein [Chitinophagaceae bacterium]
MKLFKIAFPVLFVFVIAGCKKDFADVNTNKNNPTSVTPDLLLSGV